MELAEMPRRAAQTPHDHERLLRIYLRDHEAAAVGGLQLFRQCTRSNRHTAYEAELQRLTHEISADRDSLRSICRQFDVTFSSVGRAASFAAACLTRLKPNGKGLQYSALSRVVELEALSAGVMSKLRLWESLRIHAAVDARLDGEELQQLEAAAHAQLEVLDRLHRTAAGEAFA